MADINKTVEIIFGAVDRTGSAVSGVTSRLEEVARAAESATQPLADLFDTVNRVQLGLVALGSAAGLWAINTAAEFQTAFGEIATLVDVPIDQMGEFERAVQNASSASSFSMNDYTGAVYQAISAGVEFKNTTGAQGAEVIDFTQSMERLAIAGVAGLEDTLKVTVSTLNSFGMDISEADRVADLLFTTVKQGQTTLPELAGSLAMVTLTAANSGVSLEDLLAAVAALTASGLPTSQAITGIRATLTSLLKPTDDARALAQELGITWGSAGIEAYGFAGLMELVAEKTGGNVDQMTTLFPQVQALGTAMGLTGVGLDKFVSSLEAMKNSAGAVEEAYAKMVDTFDNQNARLGNALEGLLVVFAGPLLDEVGTIQKGLTDLLWALAGELEPGGALVGFRDGLGDLLTTLGGFLQSIADNLSEALAGVDFQPLFDSFGRVGEVFLDLFGDIDLTTVEGLRDAIQTVVNVLANIQNLWASQIEEVKEFVQWIGGLVEKFGELDGESIGLIGKLLGLGKEINIVSGFAGGLFGAFGGLLNVMSNLALLNLAAKFGALPAAMSGATSAVGGLVGILTGPVGLVLAAAAAGGAVGTFISDVIEDTTGNSLGSWIYDAVQAITGSGGLTEGFLSLEEKQARAREEALRLVEAQTQAILTGGDWAESIAQTNKEYEAYGLSIRKAADGTTITVTEFNALAFASKELGKSVTDIGVAMKLYAEEQAKVTAEQQKSVDLAEAQIAADNTRLTYIAETNALLEEQGADYRILAGENSNYQRVSLDTFNRVGGSITEVIRALDGVNLTTAQVERANQLYGDSWTLVDGLVQRTVSGIGSQVQELDTTTGEWIRTVGEDGVEAFVQVGRKAPPEIKKTEDALNEAEKAAIQFQIAMEEIASNERIKFFEAKFALDIAEVEANMEIVTALLDSVGTIFESTMGGINTIFGMTQNPEWDRFGFEAKRQLDLYNDILREQVDIQKDIAEAQIAYMNAKVQAIASGNALLQVDGGSLQPHLEAFMWEILRAIQIRVNEDGLEMLLGAPA